MKMNNAEKRIKESLKNESNNENLRINVERNEAGWRHAFANNLAKNMHDKYISQSELSNVTGISSVSLSRYINERATPSGYNLEKIADALGCDITDLIR